MPTDEESALVVLVPEAEPLVSGLRSRYDRAAQRGMPAHVTVLYPFRPPDALSPALCDALGAWVARLPRFRFRLAGVCGFPGVVFLAPEPFAPFDALTAAAMAQYPDLLPYGGAFARPVPHLTIAQSPPAESLEEIAADFLGAAGGALPLDCVADAVSLAVKRGGRWRIARRFALGAG